MVGQGDHLSQVSDGHDDQCIEFRLGHMVETLQPNQQAQGRGPRLPATIGGRYERRCYELSGVKLMIKASLKHFHNWVVLVETDNKVTQAYVNHLGG